jgi:hypothetical protein
MLLRLAFTLSLASLAVADAAALVKSYDAIQQATTSLDETLNNWDGNILGSLGIFSACDRIKTILRDTAEAASSVSVLAPEDADAINDKCKDIGAAADMTIDTAIKSRSKFMKSILITDSVVLGTLDLIKSLEVALAKTVIPKEPAAMQGTAWSINSRIDKALERGIASFQK